MIELPTPSSALNGVLKMLQPLGPVGCQQSPPAWDPRAISTLLSPWREAEFRRIGYREDSSAVTCNGHLEYRSLLVEGSFRQSWIHGLQASGQHL